MPGSKKREWGKHPILSARFPGKMMLNEPKNLIRPSPYPKTNSFTWRGIRGSAWPRLLLHERKIE
jgi:hypothetical protein